MQFVCKDFPLLNEDIYSDNYFVITCLSNTLKSANSKLKKKNKILNLKEGKYLFVPTVTEESLSFTLVRLYTN